MCLIVTVLSACTHALAGRDPSGCLDVMMLVVVVVVTSMLLLLMMMMHLTGHAAAANMGGNSGLAPRLAVAAAPAKRGSRAWRRGGCRYLC